MQLSRLLGLRVIDAGSHPMGTVVDVRLTIPGDPEHDPPTPRVLGLVISPRTRVYERSAAKAPMVLAALLRWRHRGTFLAGWEDVARVATDHATLRPRLHPVLPGAGRHRLTASRLAPPAFGNL